MRFRCSWSKRVGIITLLVIGLFCFVVFKLQSEASYFIYTFLLIVNVVTIAYTPLYIEINENSLQIKRVFGSLVIPKVDIISVRRAKASFGIRKFGSGGYFGYLGWFWNNSEGNYFSYSTDEQNQVMIQTATRKYIISCDNCDDLINRLC